MNTAPPPGPWREVEGARYRETLQTTGFYVGRIVIVPREFAPIPSPPRPRLPKPQKVSECVFGGMAESIGPMQRNINPWAGQPPPVGRRRARVKNATEGARSAHRPR